MYTYIMYIYTYIYYLIMTGRSHPEATNFSKTKKLSWLADVEDLVPATLVEFDHLISKVKYTFFFFIYFCLLLLLLFYLYFYS